MLALVRSSFGRTVSEHPASQFPPVETNLEWFDKLGGPHDREEEMLDMNPERHERSRLACQIPVTEELDGMIVQLPEFQF